MKTTMLIITFALTQFVNAQELTQKEFDRMHKDAQESLFQFAYTFNKNVFAKKFNLSESDLKSFRKVNSGKRIEFYEKPNDSTYMLPFYYLTDNPKELELIVFACQDLPKRQGETFNRSDYYFVLKTNISLHDGTVSYSKTELISLEEEINNWFLSGYKSYIDKTGLVYDKFGFIPPPPPLPPVGLK